MLKIDFYVTNGFWDWEVQDYLANIWWAFFLNYNMKKEIAEWHNATETDRHTFTQRETQKQQGETQTERDREKEIVV